ncbi:vesicle-associated membrane 714 isoform A [Micractinium conductrix]|uniref:Vesicle-associated membrane 714 isoform A n=1 Tax=Micractinium conductrix TaxID=554055 RepID=A0A2P6VAB8_9CHLO|nr:vesicle-associated membrane 714 isoform A [Micractinium conductrix]|eukprot:PSC71039.1 vesicle-associated membrane 714 isoform A [Micractinium conductrix]
MSAGGPSSSRPPLPHSAPPTHTTGILYALVARGAVVLAEHSAVSGNSSVVAVGLLQKVPPDEGFRASWAAGQHIFHLLVASGLTYLCMAEQTLGTRLPFAFLSDIRQAFEARYGAVAGGAVAYEMSTEFAPVLRDRMHYFSTDPRADTLTRVRGEVSELKNVMVDNIEKVLGRGERLELLVEKTDTLGQQAFAFKRQARVMRRQMWWQNARMTVLVAGLVLLAAYILVCIICSPTFKC